MRENLEEATSKDGAHKCQECGAANDAVRCMSGRVCGGPHGGGARETSCRRARDPLAIQTSCSRRNALFFVQAHYSRRKGGVVCQVCGHLDLLSITEFKLQSEHLERIQSLPALSSPPLGALTACPEAEDGNPSSTSSIQHKPPDLWPSSPPRTDTDGPFCCPECEAYNDSVGDTPH
jgi:hypothetical protein